MSQLSSVLLVGHQSHNSLLLRIDANILTQYDSTVHQIKREHTDQCDCGFFSSNFNLYRTIRPLAKAYILKLDARPFKSDNSLDQQILPNDDRYPCPSDYLVERVSASIVEPILPPSSTRKRNLSVSYANNESPSKHKPGELTNTMGILVHGKSARTVCLSRATSTIVF